ncbi:MAG: hypothetical protein ACXIUL_12305 [Wenzhouxiangella sp.]
MSPPCTRGGAPIDIDFTDGTATVNVAASILAAVDNGATLVFGAEPGDIVEAECLLSNRPEDESGFLSPSLYLAADPRFVNPATDDYRLADDSPAIDFCTSPGRPVVRCGQGRYRQSTRPAACSSWGLRGHLHCRSHFQRSLCAVIKRGNAMKKFCLFCLVLPDSDHAGALGQGREAHQANRRPHVG